MAILSRLLIAAVAVLGVAAEAVVELTPKNFDDIVINSGKPALVEFFAPWCGHCKTLAPIYEELAQSYASSSDKVVIAKVDADAHKDLGRKYGVQGFPTLKWFDGKSKEPTDYSSGRDLESLSAFIQERTSLKAKTKKQAPSEVINLSDSTFRKTVGGDKDVLVAFTAPWCGHCKALKPTWEKVAADFVAESNVVIAQVDAEAENSKAIAQEQGISGYPTIKYFPKGSSIPQDYDGGRAEEEIVTFMNEKAGTHRAVGGGYGATAGINAALDAIVEKYYSAKDGLSAGLDELKAAATGQKNDQYAEYYTKVAQKASTNTEYVQKELKRLEGMLKKGGLAPEKRDTLTARSNILRKFQSYMSGEKTEL